MLSRATIEYRKRLQDERYLKRCGMHYLDWKAVPRKLKDAFSTQKKNAKQRGIGWDLKIGEWLRIWQESGKLALRGKFGGNYVMARFADRGPYSLDNVYIVESTKNRDLYWERKQGKPRGAMNGVFIPSWA